MYSTASFTVVIFSASSSGTSMPKASSNAITNSTWSSESAPRSSTNDAVGVTSASSTPSCSTIICFTRSSTLAIRIPPSQPCWDLLYLLKTLRLSKCARTPAFHRFGQPAHSMHAPPQGQLSNIPTRFQNICPSRQMHPTIYVQHMAGNVARLVACQKHNRRRYVPRRTHPPQRNPLFQLSLHFLGQHIRHRRLDESRRHRIHRNPPRSYFDRNRFRQTNQAGFRRHVVRLPGVSALRHHRRNIDDPPSPRLH